MDTEIVGWEVWKDGKWIKNYVRGWMDGWMGEAVQNNNGCSLFIIIKFKATHLIPCVC